MFNSNSYNKQQKQARNYLYWLCFAWMISQMIFIVWKFSQLPPPLTIPHTFPAYYLVVLAIYATVRASMRWSHQALPRKRGGMFVILWGIFALLLHIIATLSNGRLVVPTVTFTNLLFVGSVYLGSRIEKRLYLHLKKNKF